MTVSLTPEEVVKYLDDRNLISYFVVSSAVFFLYDWVLMLPVELDVVWSAKSQPLNVLYIIQRYMPFVDTIGILFAVSFAKPIEPNTCRILYTTSGWMYITGIALTEVVLTIRTWALWRNDTRLTIGLMILFLGCWAPNFYVMHLYLDSQTYIPSPLPQVGCVILGGKSILFLCWVILMVYEAGILILMLIPGLAFWLPHILHSGNWSALTTVVYRDGIAYYLVLFVLSAANVVTVLLLPHDLENLFTPYQRVMQTILTSRAILHMRSQSRKSPTLPVFVT
ncbi:hypothetical protein BDP27DRAFT_1329581 [Rhodocollybia butyracea]|uniref:DUF6533 domain-containing protein n=1 Tax=Rhodocollybia butyracea TaxID=206335 RepID=A0A9P5PPE8_9AGAR|nr:hypothetical protein BDP27DRAFT_1329581 [Rhodocollybia butyracea]